ncbi:transporter [Hymenobacter radiodurans]|uniref:transporter n=1 Tax=Hymenobacter radiodurans TaxID=2496028 RepID=UPI00105855F9|nr:transporter [Hymenobacter radiodurans]
MPKTSLWLIGGLFLATPANLLAQTTDPTLNADAPFVRNIRPDRPGRTITTNMVPLGQVQIDAGTNRFEPATTTGFGPNRTLSGATLRIGLPSHIELRLTQGYLHPTDKLAAASTMITGNDFEVPVPSASLPGGFMPLTVGAKFLASTVPNARSQVVLLGELTLRNGNTSFPNKVLEPGARLLVSQQLGQRYGLEANLGFRQRGFRAADTKLGTYLGTLALNGPLGGNFGFFAETYTTWQRESKLAPGATAGVYWRPLPNLRFDLNAGQGFTREAEGLSVGAGFSVRLPK